jgi:exodeoxyribonuclease V alpha subunit
MSEDLFPVEEAARDLKGVVIKLFFSSDTFSAGLLKPEPGQLATDRAVRFAGEVAVAEGEHVCLHGCFVEHAEYGRQFKAGHRAGSTELDAAGLAVWLGHHGIAVGVGPAKARLIAEEFGANFTGILRDNPEQVAILAKVPLESVLALRDDWLKREAMNALGTRLAVYGLTVHQVTSLYARLKGDVEERLARNPYLLLRVLHGFGFRKVDEIARRLGTPEDHSGRLAAALRHTLSEVYDQGSTCLGVNALIDTALEHLKFRRPDARQVLGARLVAMAEKGTLARVADDDRPFYALPHLHKAESAVAEFLATGCEPNPIFYRRSAADIRTDNPRLDGDQAAAVACALGNRVSLISGEAGSGKSTCISAIASLYSWRGQCVVLCAPTGKAARRLEELTGMPAYTIHKLLEYRGGNRFERNRGNPLEAQAVIADEVSMLDVELAASLFDAVRPRTAVVLVGDHHQLPPVGAGALLRDAIAHGLLPHTILTHCHRQAGTLKHNCAAILQGVVAPTEKGEPGPWYVDRSLDRPEDVLRQVERVFTEVLGPRFGFDMTGEVQLLSPKHDGPLGTRALNALLQRLHQRTLGVDLPPCDPEGKHQILCGDRVIQTRNNYDLELMNGAQGVVVEAKPLVVDFGDRRVAIPADDRDNIALAYCLTPHKYQGSEVPCAVVVCHRSHAFMLHRHWLYTAVTRAQKTCIILGDEGGIRTASTRVVADKRQTLLPLLARQPESPDDEAEVF